MLVRIVDAEVVGDDVEKRPGGQSEAFSSLVVGQVKRRPIAAGSKALPERLLLDQAFSRNHPGREERLAAE